MLPTTIGAVTRIQLTGGGGGVEVRTISEKEGERFVRFFSVNESYLFSLSLSARL